MKTEEEKNIIYMQRCLELAAMGGGYTAPNPMVGAVIVVNDRIIAEGFHQRYGEPHAEPNAIHAIANKELLKFCTLYVNLEPCSHFGKTPPCANLIVRSGIPKVVIGTLDPNPKVSGRGVRILEEAGIQVTVGVLERECNELNKRFFIYQREKRPFVLLKWAQTADNFIDINRSSWTETPLQISNEYTRILTHKMRTENQAILVSTNTVVLDNPSLTARFWKGKSPVRVALDRTGRIPDHFKLFDGEQPTIIYTGIKREHPNVRFLNLDFDSDCLKQLLNSLFENQIHSVLVEGGQQLLQNFINEGLWDEAHVEISDIRTGNGVAAPTLGVVAKETSIEKNHILQRFINHNKKFT